MTQAFAMFTFAAVLIYGALKNKSVAQTILNQPGTDRGPIVDTAKYDAASSATGGAPAPAAGGGGKAGPAVLGGASVKGHPELKPGVSKVVNAILKKYPQLSISSTTGGSHVSGSYHYSGRAADISGPANVMNEAAKWLESSMSGQLTEGIHNPGLSVKDKKKVSSSVYAAVWEGHKDHIHVAV